MLHLERDWTVYLLCLVKLFVVFIYAAIWRIKLYNNKKEGKKLVTRLHVFLVDYCQVVLNTANVLLSTLCRKNKKLSWCRETTRRFVSLHIVLSQPRSLKVIRNSTVE